MFEYRDYTGRLPYIKLGSLLSHHCRCEMKEMPKTGRGSMASENNGIKAPSSNSHCKCPHCHPTW